MFRKSGMLHKQLVNKDTMVEVSGAEVKTKLATATVSVLKMLEIVNVLNDRERKCFKEREELREGRRGGGKIEQEVVDLTKEKETVTTEVSKLKERISALEGELKLGKEEVAALGGEKTKMEDFVHSSRQWL
ncbi:hypothetical protein A2U01_0028407 [Trifolium medium]|uniref:Uncharacterized protein n=1 Tax=Trifolium medium TaxID=97028 RepID=A0A392P5J8_9FABA|nr:hypothetical protein [Trifolium medium]